MTAPRSRRAQRRERGVGAWARRPERGRRSATCAGFDGGLTELAPGTWAWLQPNGGLGESNAGLVVGDGAALLVDTLWDERLTAAMLEAIVPVCERAGAPIRHLFNTHGDGDHWYGNGLLGAGVEIVATRRRSSR